MENDVKSNDSESDLAKAHDSAPATAAIKRVLRIWVVEDSAQLRDCFAQFLTRQAGFKCNGQFASSEAMLQALQEERAPDMILMDVNLEGRTGLSAIRPAKKLAPSVRIVMMTTFTNSHYELEAYNAGASGFLLKSFELDQILNILRDAYRRPGTRELFPSLKYHEPQPELPLSESVAPDSRGALKLIKSLFWARQRGRTAD